ncbi:MAG: MoaD/ThiS family protein [SAR324 cluster bacterium]|nr:MoaD/ThiS family protein [SAR324 cluster bacterium]MCZ6730023.1 MoaD/ThiS family protein [SAR324 cluster bacterium]
MSARVALGPVLADIIGGLKYLDIEGATVEEVLRNLSATHQELAPLLWRSTGEINPILVIFHNSQVIREGKGLDAPVKSGDEIAVISSLEGG